MSCLLPLVLVPALAFASLDPARAELVTITVGGATFSAHADTVTLTPRSFTLDLAPDIPLTTGLQPAEFNVDESHFATGAFPGTLSRPVSAGG